MFNKVVGNPGFIITNTGQILEGLGVVLQDVGTHLLGRGQHPRHTAADVVYKEWNIIYQADIEDKAFPIIVPVKSNKGVDLVKEEGV